MKSIIVSSVCISLLACLYDGCAHRQPVVGETDTRNQDQTGKQWKATYHEKGTNAVLDFDGMTVVFEGILDPRPFNGSRITEGGQIAVVQVAGGHPLPELDLRRTDFTPNSIGVRVGTQNLYFTELYLNGRNTMSFGGHKFELRDGGRELIFGTTSFLLDHKKTIIVDAKGNARLLPAQ